MKKFAIICSTKEEIKQSVDLCIQAGAKLGIYISVFQFVDKASHYLDQGGAAVYIGYSYGCISDSLLYGASKNISDSMKSLKFNVFLIKKELGLPVDGPSEQINELINKIREQRLLSEKQLETLMTETCSTLQNKIKAFDNAIKALKNLQKSSDIASTINKTILNNQLSVNGSTVQDIVKLIDEGLESSYKEGYNACELSNR